MPTGPQNGAGLAESRRIANTRVAPRRFGDSALVTVTNCDCTVTFP